MQDTLALPACFALRAKPAENEPSTAAGAVVKPGHAVTMSTYHTKIGGQWRLVMVTWCKNLLVHGLSISVHGAEQDDGMISCKLEVRPWHFWRRQGSKRFFIEGAAVDVTWDLRAAKFGSEAEPASDFYVAMVYEEEVVLLVGDLKKEAFRRTGSRPSLVDAVLVTKREHIFGKKKFCTRAKFHERGKFHKIAIERSEETTLDPEMVIRVDGQLVVHVKHLQWKFRGNESISINDSRVEVFWDVHAWLFNPGLRHALFIFKPMSSALSSPPLSASSSSTIFTPSSLITAPGLIENGSSEFCLFLYAWRSD